MPGVRLLVAPDKFKGTFAAAQVAAAVGRGVERAGEPPPELCPIADGGEGTLAVLLTALGGETLGAEVADPLGRSVRAGFALVEDGGTAIVETATAEALFRDPRHPYTQGLISCIPVPGKTRPGERLGVIPGVVPSLVGDLTGCPFRTRCPHARAICAEEPPHRGAPDAHAWRCILEAA